MTSSNNSIFFLFSVSTDPFAELGNSQVRELLLSLIFEDSPDPVRGVNMSGGRGTRAPSPYDFARRKTAINTE